MTLKRVPRKTLELLIFSLFGCATQGPPPAPVFPERHYETELPVPEAFQRYLADFQRDPRDDHARSQVIDLAGKLDPRPKRPPQAEELAGKAVAAIKHASNPSDFLDAAAAFDQALQWAPWIGSFYNNAAVAFEKGGRPDLAIKYYRWYLQAAPGDPDASKIRTHIGELQFEADKRAKLQAQVAWMEQGRWVHGGRNAFGDNYETSLVVRGGKLIWIGSKGSQIVLGALTPNFQLDTDPDVLRRTWPVSVSQKFRFAADLMSIMQTDIDNSGKTYEVIYYRR